MLLIEYLHFCRHQLPSCYLSGWICIAIAMSQITFFSCYYLMILTDHAEGLDCIVCVHQPASMLLLSQKTEWQCPILLYPMFMWTPRIFHQVFEYCKNNDCPTRTLKVYQINLRTASVHSEKIHRCLCASVPHPCFSCTSLTCALSWTQGYCVSSSSEDQFLDTVGDSVSKIANYLEITSWLERSALLLVVSVSFWKRVWMWCISSCNHVTCFCKVFFLPSPILWECDGYSRGTHEH